MHVYSRQTRSLLVSFPPVHDRENDDHRDECCARAIPLSLTHDFKERLQPKPQSLSQLPDGGKYAPIATAHQRGWEPGEGPFYTTLERATAMHAVGDPDDSEEYDTQWEFSACHYTPDYLVCTAKSGGVFLVQDYRKVLREVASVPAKRRSKYITDNTVVLGLGTTVRQLTTFGHRLALCTVSHYAAYIQYTLTTVLQRDPDRHKRHDQNHRGQGRFETPTTPNRPRPAWQPPTSNEDVLLYPSGRADNLPDVLGSWGS